MKAKPEMQNNDMGRTQVFNTYNFDKDEVIYTDYSHIPSTHTQKTSFKILFLRFLIDAMLIILSGLTYMMLGKDFEIIFLVLSLVFLTDMMKLFYDFVTFSLCYFSLDKTLESKT